MRTWPRDFDTAFARSIGMRGDADFDGIVAFTLALIVGAIFAVGVVRLHMPAGLALVVSASIGAGAAIKAGMGMGEDVAPVIERLLANPEVSYLHAHNAMHGCYAARIDRA